MDNPFSWTSPNSGTNPFSFNSKQHQTDGTISSPVVKPTNSTSSQRNDIQKIPVIKQSRQMLTHHKHDAEIFFEVEPPYVRRKVTSAIPELLPLLQSPHPEFTKHRLLLFNDDGDAVLHHPSLLQYPNDVIIHDPLAHPASLSILKRYTAESYTAYLSSYTSLWNLLTHLMANQETAMCQLPDLILLAAQWLLQSRQPEQTASVWSHLKFYQEIHILPGDKFVKWSLVNCMSRNFRPLKSKLQFRLILLPKFFVEIFGKFGSFQSKKFVAVSAAVDPITIYICLALTCGHHLEESYNFSWKNHIIQNYKFHSFQFNGISIHYPPFKRRDQDVYIPASHAFLIIFKHVQQYYPMWLNEIPIAQTIWNSFASAVSEYLVTYDDTTFPNEAMTHRILRRSYASYLHQLEISAPVLTALLTHNSKKALASYVSQINSSGQDIISSHRFLFHSLKPPAQFMMFINAPAYFTFSGQAKKTKTGDGHQPKISGFLTTS